MKNFAIFKAEKKTDKGPDYNISMKVGDNYQKIGACWLKEGKSGKYFSCSLNKEYKDEKGYSVVEDVQKLNDITAGEVERLQKLREAELAPKVAIKPSDIPF